MSFWFEWHRELRRQAGDEHLPAHLRTALKERARQAAARAAVADQPRQHYARRAIHAKHPVIAHAPAGVGDRSSAPPVAIVEMRRRIDLFADALAWLRDRGYHVVRLGAGAERMAGVEDLSRPGGVAPTGDELSRLGRAHLLICESPEFQRSACAANLPTLLLNATDPFMAYPVRADGLFTLQTPVDLDTGEVLTPRAMLEERYFRNLRNYGYRANTAAEMLDAVRELHDGSSAGEWRESSAQQRYREDAMTAGAALAARIPSVAEWGPDHGFLGDGRLARCQAEHQR